MVWNTGLVFVEKVDVARIVDEVEVLPRSGRFVPMHEAMSKVAVGKVRGWAVLWARAVKPDLLEVLSKGTRGFGCTLSSAQASFGFEWWVDGKRLRKATFDSGEPAEAEGPELRAERGIKLPDWGHDEDFIFSVLERLTGLTQEDLEGERYQVLGEKKLELE